MEWACKDCHRIFRDGSVCKGCGSSAISKEWKGYVVILDAKNSEIAKKLGIKEEGRYALKVR